VDLAKDPNTGGPLARSTTPKLKLAKALVENEPLKGRPTSTLKFGLIPQVAKQIRVVSESGATLGKVLLL
jgi:hypothetical protein